MEDLKTTMPDGIEYVIALDTTDFVRISIEEVIHTLFEAILLVILVVYLLPAELPFHDHLYCRGLRFVDRHLRRHARARVFPSTC